MKLVECLNRAELQCKKYSGTSRQKAFCLIGRQAGKTTLVSSPDLSLRLKYNLIPEIIKLIRFLSEISK
jgi:hypothetical protein